MTLTFQKVTPDLIDQVVQIEQQSFSPWTENQLHSELSKTTSKLYVLFDGDEERVIAWVALSVVAFEAELLKIAVDKNYRRCGHASRILDYLFHKLEREKVKKLFLEVRSQNSAACSLYKKHNFKEISGRKAYYTSPVDDALIFMKAIL